MQTWRKSLLFELKNFQHHFLTIFPPFWGIFSIKTPITRYYSVLQQFWLVPREPLLCLSIYKWGKPLLFEYQNFHKLSKTPFLTIFPLFGVFSALKRLLLAISRGYNSFDWFPESPNYVFTFISGANLEKTSTFQISKYS